MEMGGYFYDFMTGLPRGRKGNDAIWMVVDRLTKSVLFFSMKITDSVVKLTKLYVNEVIKLYGVLVSIISDRDPRFTSRLWPSLNEHWGQLNVSTTFHPQTDGQSGRTIQTLKDLLGSCLLEFRGNWEDLLPFMEFTYYNNIHQATISMAPYEALYERKCRTPICSEEVGKKEAFGT
jgi:hypothetical protein